AQEHTLALDVERATAREQEHERHDRAKQASHGAMVAPLSRDFRAPTYPQKPTTRAMRPSGVSSNTFVPFESGLPSAFFAIQSTSPVPWRWRGSPLRASVSPAMWTFAPATCATRSSRPRVRL